VGKRARCSKCGCSFVVAFSGDIQPELSATQQSSVPLDTEQVARTPDQAITAPPPPVHDEGIVEVEVTWWRAFKVWWRMVFYRFAVFLVCVVLVTVASFVFALLRTSVASAQADDGTAPSRVASEPVDSPSRIGSEPVVGEAVTFPPPPAAPTTPARLGSLRRDLVFILLLFVLPTLLIDVPVVGFVLRMRFRDFRVTLAWP
jgi:hypothetical protein